MAYINIDIEDHIDEIDTDFLIRELKNRKLRKEDRKAVNSWALDDERKDALITLGVTSVRDVSKMEAFLEKYKDVPESDLDEFLNRY